MNEQLDDLAHYRLIDLTTFRRTGEPVTTPVRYAVDHERIVVSLQTHSGKVKRARANPAVIVAGHPNGPRHEGVLRFLDGDEARAARRVLRREHRLLYLQRLLLGRHPHRHRAAEIRLKETSTRP